MTKKCFLKITIIDFYVSKQTPHIKTNKPNNHPIQQKNKKKYNTIRKKGHKKEGGKWDLNNE